MNRPHRFVALPPAILCCLACGLACAMRSGSEAPDDAKAERQYKEGAIGLGYAEEEAPGDLDLAILGTRGGGGAPAAAMEPMAPPPMTAAKPAESRTRNGGGDDEFGESEFDDALATESTPEPARAWFPEAFLWRPIVETGAEGNASLSIKVPDTLTTWRVLAMGHTRNGYQAGAVHTFDSTLPRYVDPVVPGWLAVGDEVVLPVQVVNNSETAIATPVTLTADGAVLVGGGTTAVSLAAFGSSVHTFTLSASTLGTGHIDASIDGDRVTRDVPVLPVGKPYRTKVTGTLTDRATLELMAPDDAHSHRLTVWLMPGPLALFRQELGRAGTGAWDGGYGFALAHHLESLAESAHAEVDASALRKLRLLSWQRIVRDARAPDVGTASDLLLSLRDVSGHEQAETLRDRLVSTVEMNQRADGTWSRVGSSSLQRLIVETAQTAWSLPEGSRNRKRAAGALERYAGKVKDPYTAAVVLATGLVGDAAAGVLREQLVDGSDVRPLPPSLQNAWGIEPATTEYLAWASLALMDDAHAEARGRAIAAMLERYDTVWGFGAGPADPVALDAVARALPGLDGPLEATLLADGQEVSRLAVDPHTPVAFLADRTGRRWELVADRPVAGVVYVAQLDARVPWTDEPAIPGITVELDPGAPAAGVDHFATLVVAGPAGPTIEVTLGLPPGTDVDDAELRDWSSVADARAFEDRLWLVTRPLSVGEVLRIPIRLRCTFAGTFTPAATNVKAERFEGDQKPPTWTIQ